MPALSSRRGARRSLVRGRLALAALTATLGLSCGDDIYWPISPYYYRTDLAKEVPMTGNPSELFGEVDIVMRQFLKWRCGGAAVLAISYKGRRVYKRGFGRMRGRATEELYGGCGDDETNPFDPDAPLTQPDSPMVLASLSKAVTGALGRWLIEERVKERGVTLPPCDGPLCGCDEPPCPATVADVPLLHPELDLLPEHLAELLRGDEPLPVPVVGERPCIDGHDPAYADPRWKDVTIGSLISHQSGLMREGWSFWDDQEGAVNYLPELRGFDGEDEDAWRHEDAVVRERFPQFAHQIEIARTKLSGLHGGAPVYFVNLFNAAGGEAWGDEFRKTLFRGCLTFNPGASGYYDHVNGGLYQPIDEEGVYSNAAVGIVGRVVDHLQQERTGQSLAAQPGDPEGHWGSALEEYFAERLGVEGGVETPEGIYLLQQGQNDKVLDEQPLPRVWRNGSFYADLTDFHRPYCVMTEEGCSFRSWVDAKLGETTLRPPYDWSLNEDPELGFAGAPVWSIYPRVNLGAGMLVAEAPVYLAFSAEHHISGDTSELDNLNGAARELATGVPGGHSGLLAGAYAWVLQLKGRDRLVTLPPVVDGHLTDIWFKVEDSVLQLPDDVDFVVGVNQSDDPRCYYTIGETGRACSNEYRMLRDFVRFGISRVDWDAVKAEIDAQEETVVGMAVDSLGRTHYWYADDRHDRSDDDPRAYDGREGVVEGDPDDDDARLAIYELPSTRIGPDVVAVTLDAEDRVLAWFDDGRVSAGYPRDLSALNTPVKFELAEGHEVQDIVAVAIDRHGAAHAWYRDGTRSVGKAWELAAGGVGEFRVPDGRAIEEIAAITFARDEGREERVWTRYTDGHVSLGTIDDLAAFED